MIKNIRRAGTAFGLLLALASLFAGFASAAPPPAADLDQCANGTLASPQLCAGAQWQNGNVNGNQAHWREGDSVPYRMKLTGLNTVTTQWTLVIGYDVTNSSKHALDYITSFDRTEHQPGNNPCSGQTCSTSNFATLTIPDDPLGPQHCSALPGKTEVPDVLMTLFSAAGKTSTIDGFGTYMIKSGSTFSAAICANIGAGTTEAIAIHFTTDDASPVFAWGEIGRAHV